MLAAMRLPRPLAPACSAGVASSLCALHTDKCKAAGVHDRCHLLQHVRHGLTGCSVVLAIRMQVLLQAGMLSPRPAARRALLQSSSTPAAPAESAGNSTSAEQTAFTTGAIGYGTFLITLYFAFAAIYCMCNMPIKQDTLLYARSKVE